MEQERNALDLDPHYMGALVLASLLYGAVGKHEEAIQAAEETVQLSGRSNQMLGYLGWVYAAVGRIEEARKLLEELKARDQRTYVQPSSIAWIYLALGEFETAIDWVEKMVDERDANFFLMAVDPIWDSVRSHPRFQAILRKMNLQR